MLRGVRPSEAPEVIPAPPPFTQLSGCIVVPTETCFLSFYSWLQELRKNTDEELSGMIIGNKSDLR